MNPNKLQKVDIEEPVLPGGITTPEPKQRFRDVLKMWQAACDYNAAYALFGVENQSSVHYAMPVKFRLCGFMNYTQQVET